MSETKKDCELQLDYMLNNKSGYLKNIDLKEYTVRIRKLRKQIRTGIEQ